MPLDVLVAVSLLESGRDNQPWPWAVNMDGIGHWLDSQGAAVDLVESAIKDGRTNIDIGCFQINYRWHADGFSSVTEMFMPEANALYAARFLAEKQAATGDWALAAAAYHSATPEHADRYLARFESVLAGVAGTVEPWTIQPRSNAFPLLLAGRYGANGSLVPDTPRGPRLLGGP